MTHCTLEGLVRQLEIAHLQSAGGQLHTWQAEPRSATVRTMKRSRRQLFSYLTAFIAYGRRDLR